MKLVVGGGLVREERRWGGRKWPGLMVGGERTAKDKGFWGNRRSMPLSGAI